MHELSLCQNILKTIESYAHTKDIKYIDLEIGTLALVEKSALLFHFNILKKDTIAQNAVLRIIDIPSEAFCNNCQKDVILEKYYDPCPICQQFSLTITKGQELKIKSIEVS